MQGHCGCGFDTDRVFVGAGFTNFIDTCNAPAICLNCGEFLVRNYVEKGTARCPACKKRVTFYNDPSVHDCKCADGDPEYLITWWIAGRDEFFKLEDTRYLCPRCGKMTLVFSDRGLWD